MKRKNGLPPVHPGEVLKEDILPSVGLSVTAPEARGQHAQQRILKEALDGGQRIAHGPSHGSNSIMALSCAARHIVEVESLKLHVTLSRYSFGTLRDPCAHRRRRHGRGVSRHATPGWGAKWPSKFPPNVSASASSARPTPSPR